MDTLDTIAAIATAPGTGGVGIIRISGPAALRIGLALFTPAKAFNIPEPQRLYFGRIGAKKQDALVDKGYFVFMKSPLSFTGEDVVELHCHGGPLLLQSFLNSVLSAEVIAADRARLAEPGEFTKRAFLNGKLELSEAEAVAELINATTECALAMAGSKLLGVLAEEIAKIKETLLELVTHVEAELDFAEEEMIDALSDEHLDARLSGVGERIGKLIKTYGQGSALADGVKVVITGKPNTGKSSLLNRLLKEERAIVTPLAGTTRDVIEESVVIKGLPVRLMDTAGLRDDGAGHASVDEVEAIGIERARERIREARVVLFVVDGSAQEFAQDKRLLQSLMAQQVTDKIEEQSIKKIIIVANKSDKAGFRTAEIAALLKIDGAQEELPIIAVSARSGAGIEGLEDAFFKAVTGYDLAQCLSAVQSEAFITTLREKDALVRAMNAIEKSKETVSEKTARECLALELRGALSALGEISGETTSEDILNRIFSDFCIGK